MALSQDKVTFISPLNQHEQGEDVDDYYENNVSPQGCDCFPLFCFQWRRGSESSRLLHQNGGEYRESWLIQKVKKVKEASEVFAGPKWKTLIRKVGGYVKRNKYKNRFQYDPQSYALNFDSSVDMEDRGLVS
ncbi:uncharacterized protein LOC123194904 [Mangifera indica]|uniref:uncharacterized protein LOC123194904 n=1 Tax=Mangifera indica TaxID=29780 RepID=UPI001CFAA8CF|nr:uncharacterized protein LOC123194904 [Mangifera indica]